MLSPFKYKDKLFYDWVVVATFFIVGMAIWGIRFSYGIFFKSLESEFDLNRAATSSIFSVHMILGMVALLVALARQETNRTLKPERS